MEEGDFEEDNFWDNADIDNNGIVGLSDVVILPENYGEHSP